MKQTKLPTFRAFAAGAALILGCTIGPLLAQQPTPPAGQPAAGGRGGRGGAAGALFGATDTNKDGAVTREEFKSTLEGWFATWDTAAGAGLTQAQIAAGVSAALPQPVNAGAQGDACGGRSANPRAACPGDVDKMMAALPDKAPAKPLKPRKLLVFARSVGFIHSSIPLAAKTAEALGAKTGAWTATVTFDAADINTANLKQYDGIFLDNTTGCFLDDPADKPATDARRAALLEFVRSGKGLAGIHAASDSYHGQTCGAAPAGGGGRATGPGASLVTPMLTQGDTNGDQRLSRQEMSALADVWFDKLDPQKTGRIALADFTSRFASIIPPPEPGAGRGNAATGVPGGQPLWPEFNRMIGGYFKFHWNDPQLITVKIDDPRSPLTSMFNGRSFEVHDETYTFNQESFSRSNVHVLTSVDYAQMSDEDKAKEPNARADHDYALSWIRREGSGRVFYEAHGHGERIYAMRPMLEHILAGIQYALGDLKADDSPSAAK